MVRERRPQDLPRLARVLAAVHRSGQYPVRWPDDPESWIAGPEALHAWIVESGGGVSGHLSLHEADPDGLAGWTEALGVGAEELVVIRRFFVDPALHGRGLGSSLLERAAEWAAAHGRRQALDVAKVNTASVNFYERRGWRRAGESVILIGPDRFELPVWLYVEPE
jgi:GNAT superfamily N-acetyltransferase